MVIAEDREDDYENIVYEIDNMGEINRNYQYGRHPTLAMQEIQRFGVENDPDFDKEKADRNKDGVISDWEQSRLRKVFVNTVKKKISPHQ